MPPRPQRMSLSFTSTTNSWGSGQQLVVVESQMDMASEVSRGTPILGGPGQRDLRPVANSGLVSGVTRGGRGGPWGIPKDDWRGGGGTIFDVEPCIIGVNNQGDGPGADGRGAVAAAILFTILVLANKTSAASNSRNAREIRGFTAAAAWA